MRSLDWDKVSEIRLRSGQGEGARKLAVEFGVSPTTIYRIVRWAIWKFRKSPIDRFWSHVYKGNKEECWEWQCHKDPKGYGRFSLRDGNRTIMKLAHRYSLEIFLGRDLLPSECALHRCDNPSCVNPTHLFIGDRADNNHDMINKGRFRHHGGMRGEAHGASKLNDVFVLKIRRLHRKGKCNQSELARQFGVHHSVVNDVVHYRTWRHLP